MKKYVKPDLFYENFELSHTIANCSLPLNHQVTEVGCGISEYDGVSIGVTLFTAGANCDADISIWTDDYCEFTGTSDYNVFTS